MFALAQQKFVDEAFDESAALFAQVLEADPGNVEARINRSAALAKLGDYQDALDEALTVLAREPENAKALLRQGIALFGLGEPEKATVPLKKALEVIPEDRIVKMWVRKCAAEIEASAPKPLSAATAAPVAAVPVAAAQKQSEQSVTVPASAAPAASSAGAKPTVRREWYQTDHAVILSLFVKNVPKDNVAIHFSESALSVTIKQPTGTDYSLELDLAFPTVPSQSNYTVFGTKIEIKLHKAEVGLRWPDLESSGAPITTVLAPMASAPAPVASAAASKPVYPSSSKKHKNWDQLESEAKKEEAEEKPEGDAALNALFKQIYSNGSDEQRRAMIKSYTESGGTTLSTNWSEVGVKPVEIKPPTGMVAKKYGE